MILHRGRGDDVATSQGRAQLAGVEWFLPVGPADFLGPLPLLDLGSLGSRPSTHHMHFQPHRLEPTTIAEEACLHTIRCIYYIHFDAWPCCWISNFKTAHAAYRYTLPGQFSKRHFYHKNPNIHLLPTTPQILQLSLEPYGIFLLNVKENSAESTRPGRLIRDLAFKVTPPDPLPPSAFFGLKRFVRVYHFCIGH